MRLKGMLAVIVLALVSATADGQGDPYQPFHDLLAKQCPAKHLEWLSGGELDDLIEVNFLDTLPGPLQTKLDTAYDQEKQACASNTMGLTCFNAAYLKAMDDVAVLPRFAKMVCASNLSCKTKGDCGHE
jgi:hypothetical protein